MSNIKVQGNVSGTGSLTIAAPNTNTDRTLTLPDESGTVLTSASPVIAQAGVPAFSAYRATNQALSNGVFTKIAFDTEEFDTNSNYDTATNYRFTPNVAGYYLITTEARLSASTLADWSLNIYKNGASFKRGNGATNNTSSVQVSAASLIYLNGSTDYVEVYVYTGASSGNVATGGAEYTYFQGVLVRAA